MQRWILREARERGQLEYPYILKGYFGWTPTGTDAQLRDRFSPASIGPAEYNRVMATVSRSCRRLEERGLITLEGYAPYLRWIIPTKAGLEVDLERRSGK